MYILNLDKIKIGTIFKLKNAEFLVFCINFDYLPSIELEITNMLKLKKTDHLIYLGSKIISMQEIKIIVFYSLNSNKFVAILPEELSYLQINF